MMVVGLLVGLSSVVDKFLKIQSCHPNFMKLGVWLVGPEMNLLDFGVYRLFGSRIFFHFIQHSEPPK